MSIKFLFVLCVGVLASQGYPSQDAETSGDFENVTEMLKKLEEDVEVVSQNAIHTMNGSFQNMTVTIATIRQISQLAYSWRSQYVDAIEQLAAAYTNQGFDVTNCTVDQLDTLYRLPEEIVDNVSTCFDDKYKKLQNIMKEVTGEINAILKSIEKFWNEITECQNKTSEEQPDCISKITSKITKDADSTPIEIISLVSDATELIATQKTDLFHCYDNDIINYRNTVQQTLKESSDCLSDLKPNPVNIYH